MPQITGKALRALAVLGDQRAPQLPDVPTARESGGPLANFNVSSWNGLAVPAKTPPAVIARLNREVQAALAQPDVKQRLLELNLVAAGQHAGAAGRTSGRRYPALERRDRARENSSGSDQSQRRRVMNIRHIGLIGYGEVGKIFGSRAEGQARRANASAPGT